MKRVKLRTIMAGPKGVKVPGDVFEVSDAEARRWIKAGYASEVEPEKEIELELKEEPVPESTSVEPPENTSKPAAVKARTSRGKKSKRKR